MHNTKMLRSKSRSGSVDFGQKNHYSSVFSRTLSASKLCRGDALGAQIDSKALKSIDKKLYKVSNLSENQVDRFTLVQRQMEEMEEELRITKEKLREREMEKDQVEAKEAANEANMMELKKEVENLKNKLGTLEDELKTKDKNIDSLELELEKCKQLEHALIEKDASLDKLHMDLTDLREREKDKSALLSENKKRIQELEDEVERAKTSESMMVDKLSEQSKHLEAATVQLQESNNEITSLQEKIASMELLSRNNNNREVEIESDSSEETITALKLELQKAKENLALSQEEESGALLKAKSMVDEMELLKKELKLASEAEEKSTKAMEDLALALKEVATEATEAKEKHNITQMELENLKREAKEYQKHLSEAKQEAELQQNTADRLRVEAEESLLAWNGKEMGFVTCIKRAEEEKAIAQHECNKLSESLKAAENMTRAAREESYKLRDILKQAVNEANAAKAAAGIARDENSLLKDCLSEKEEALHFITKENERFRISEAAAHENVKQLKRFLSIGGSTDFKNEGKEEHGLLSFTELVDEELQDENKITKRSFSFDREDLKFLNEPDQDSDEIFLDADPEKAECLKGSIFDATAETPRSEPHTPKSSVSHLRRYSSAFADDGESPYTEDFGQFNRIHDDMETDKVSNKPKKTMFRRVGDLLTIRKSFHKKEQSIG